MKKISILLPVYNSETTIKDCISSILSSTHKNFELVIVNDGSNDLSREIIYTFKDQRLIYLEKENSGLVHTLNYGIKKCSTDIIMRIDSDDKIKPEKISIQLNEMINSKSLLVGTNAYLINKNDNIIGQTNLPLEHSEIVKSMTKMRASIIHPSIMVYKDVFDKVGYFDEKYNHAEDFDLFFRVSSLGSIRNIPDKLMFLRKSENNISHKNANEQITNGFISRENYLKNNNYSKTSKKNFKQYKKNIKNSYLKRAYIYIHTEIVKTEYNYKNNYTQLILYKIFRRLISLFL